jgi:hypothetical protein
LTTILTEANDLIFGARQEKYGHPIEDFARTAVLLEGIFECRVPIRKAALAVVAVKISRECNLAYDDNRRDMAGYAGVEDMICTAIDLIRQHHPEVADLALRDDDSVADLQFLLELTRDLISKGVITRGVGD